MPRGLGTPEGRDIRPWQEFARRADFHCSAPRCRAALIKASEQSGRSISEELETRLERSFDLESEFGGAATFQLLLAYAQALQSMEAAEGARWYESSDKGRLVMARAAFAMSETMNWQTTWMEPATPEIAEKALAEFNDLAAGPRPPESDPQSVVLGQAELARRKVRMTPAISDHPAELFDKADFHEALHGAPNTGKDNAGDETNLDVSGEAPADRSGRRKTRA